MLNKICRLKTFFDKLSKGASTLLFGAFLVVCISSCVNDVASEELILPYRTPASVVEQLQQSAMVQKGYAHVNASSDFPGMLLVMGNGHTGRGFVSLLRTKDSIPVRWMYYDSLAASRKNNLLKDKNGSSDKNIASAFRYWEGSFPVEVFDGFRTYLSERTHWFDSNNLEKYNGSFIVFNDAAGGIQTSGFTDTSSDLEHVCEEFEEVIRQNLFEPWQRRPEESEEIRFPYDSIPHEKSIHVFVDVALGAEHEIVLFPSNEDGFWTCRYVKVEFTDDSTRNGEVLMTYEGDGKEPATFDMKTVDETSLLTTKTCEQLFKKMESTSLKYSYFNGGRRFLDGWSFTIELREKGEVWSKSYSNPPEFLPIVQWMNDLQQIVPSCRVSPSW